MSSARASASWTCVAAAVVAHPTAAAPPAIPVALASAVFAVSALIQGGSALALVADVEWCYEDPVVVVFGASQGALLCSLAAGGGWAPTEIGYTRRAGHPPPYDPRLIDGS